MSKTITAIALTLGCVMAAAGAGADDAKTAAAEKVLTDKGLTKDDRKFLLDEKAAVEKYEEARSAYADFKNAMNKYATIVQYDEGVMTMEMQRQGLQEEVNMLQMQINSTPAGYGRMRNLVNQQLAPLRQQQSQDRALMNQLNSQVQAAKGQGPKPEQRKAVAADFDRTRQAYNDKVRELHTLLAPLLEKYHELALDPAVTDALTELRRITTHNYKLGPSDTIVAASKLTHEKAATAKSKPASKKKAKAKGS